MYIEYVIIFIALGVIIALLIAAVIMLGILFKDRDKSMPVYNRNLVSPQTQDGVPAQKSNKSSSSNVVFCRHCAASFDSSQKVCPSCGNQR